MSQARSMPAPAAAAFPSLSKGALAILLVAEQLFAEKGYDAVSVNTIAQQAGVSKANIFHHFKSKEALYLAVLKMACSRSARVPGSDEAVTGDENARPASERMSDFFSSHLQTVLAQPLSSRLIQWELMENGKQRGKQLAEEVFADTFNRVVNLVQQAKYQGAVRSEIDPSLLAFLMIGINVFFFETRHILKHLPGIDFADCPADYSSAAFDLLANGFEKTP